MPYINQDARAYLKDANMVPRTAGELNYILTQEVLAYLSTHKFNYQTINDIKGALQGALSEFDRRVVAPYEDKKIAENGDLNWPLL